MNEENSCDMRGMLSFMILWLLSKRPMYGQELAVEIGKRRGGKPNPGTIYPALRDLSDRGMIASILQGHSNVYELTERERDGLIIALKYFKKAFGEILDSPLTVPQRRRGSKRIERHDRLLVHSISHLTGEDWT